MTARLLLPNQPITSKGDLPSRDLVEIIQRLVSAVGSGGGGVSDGDKGDVTVSGAGTVWTIDADTVTNAKLDNMATNRIKGRETAGTGDPEDLTMPQVTAMLHEFTTGLQGVVPASGGGTTNFLRADGSWSAPAGGSGGASPATAWVI